MRYLTSSALLLFLVLGVTCAAHAVCPAATAITTVTSTNTNFATVDDGSGNCESKISIANVGGSAVATAATGIQKVGVTDSTGNAINSSANALNVNIASGGTVAQGSTTSGQGGALVMGAASTVPPSYVTAQTNPLSQDLNGGLRVAPLCNKVINIFQTATTDVHTFIGFGYICSINLIVSAAMNIGLDEGIGTTCETSGTALIGVSSTTAATPGYPAAANGGFSMVSGVPFMRTQTSGDHLCVLQGTGTVAGTITYADLTN